MNWIKILFTGGLGLLIALGVMLLIEKFGGIASEVADSIPSVLLTQEDMTRDDQADSIFASSIGTGIRS